MSGALVIVPADVVILFSSGAGASKGGKCITTINVSNLGQRQGQVIEEGWSGRVKAKLGNPFRNKTITRASPRS